MQRRFRKHAGNMQGTFREHSGNIQGTLVRACWYESACTIPPLASKNLRGVMECKSCTGKLAATRSPPRSTSITTWVQVPVGSVLGFMLIAFYAQIRIVYKSQASTTVTQWDYTTPSDQSQTLRENIPHHLTNHSPSEGIYHTI
jgi:hypothetical protein